MSNGKTRMSVSERRRFLESAWAGVAGTLAVSLMPGCELSVAPRYSENPFNLGVASGDLQPDGAVNWTRLAPQPNDPGSLGSLDIPVLWRTATD